MVDERSFIVAEQIAGVYALLHVHLDAAGELPLEKKGGTGRGTGKEEGRAEAARTLLPDTTPRPMRLHKIVIIGAIRPATRAMLLTMQACGTLATVVQVRPSTELNTGSQLEPSVCTCIFDSVQCIRVYQFIVKHTTHFSF